MGVSASSSADDLRARAIAGQLGAPLLAAGIDPRSLPAGLVLLQVGERHSLLCPTGRGAPGPVGIDFSAGALWQRRRGGHNELLGRAVGWKAGRAPRVLDATAGFANDAFVLAELGCSVLLCERHRLLALMLQEAVAAATAVGGREAAVAARMRLHAGDARELDPPALAAVDVDVIYLDPMFAQPRRAAPGKAMQLLQQLLDADGVGDDGAGLLTWARAQAVRRVVVKRPRRAAPLPGPAPGHSLSGTAVRFDVYPLSRRDTGKSQENREDS